MPTPTPSINVNQPAQADRPLRVVYFGPGLSGKTANLLSLARLLPDGAGRIRHLQADTDGGAPFELLACEGAELGFASAGRLHLLTVPGRYLAARSRRSLLAGADGIVFVADSRPERSDANVVLLDELGSHLADLGLVPPRVGLVIQYNRSDARDAFSAKRLDRVLNRHDGPRATAVAHRGEGVLETLRLLISVMPLSRD